VRGKPLLLFFKLNAEPSQEICPGGNSDEIAHLDSVFRQAMKLIRDNIIDYVQKHCELDEDSENFR
jgi:hypothetical protein